MRSLITRVSPTLDGAPQILGDGVARVRTIRVASGYTPPVYLRADSSIRRVYRLETLPADLVLPIGRVEILSGDPGAAPGGAFYYVATDGSAANDGSLGAPWTLAHALSGAGGVLQPGDTVWLRGGTYVGTFVPSCPNGTPNARIAFRQYGGDAPLGERVRIDGEFQMTREYLDLRGVEVFQTDPNATALAGIILGHGSDSAKGARVINCVVHDCGETGCTGWLNARGPSLYYGVISYNNGTHHNLDHGFYIHDQEKVIELCIAFNNLARGFQAWDQVRDQAHIAFRKCIAFGNGEISTIVGADTNFLARVKTPLLQDDIALEDCVGFHADASVSGSRQLRLGTDGNGPSQGRAYVRGGYFWRGRTTVEVAQWQELTLEDSVIISPSETSDVLILRAAGRDWTSWERNAWYLDPALLKWTYKRRRAFADWQSATGLGATDTAQAGAPATRYFLWPNEFEPGRGHLAIFNHDGLPSVPVDLSTVMPPGTDFEIRNVQDLWGTPAVTGTFDGSPVAVPMTGVAPPTPGGASRVFATPPTTAPEFDAFLVLAV